MNDGEIKGKLLKKLIGKFYILEEDNPHNWDQGHNPIVVKHTLEDCLIIFKNLYNSGTFGHDVKYHTYRIRSFMVDDFESDWKVERDYLENLLPQQKAKKDLNDDELTKECNEYISSKECLSAGTFHGRSVDCFMKRRDDRFKSRLCEIHKCTHTKCNCNILVDEFYEILRKRNLNVDYEHPIVIQD